MDTNPPTKITGVAATKGTAAHQGHRPLRAPSTAEYLDAVRACRVLGIAVGSAKWALVRDMVLVKPRRIRDVLDVVARAARRGIAKS